LAESFLAGGARPEALEIFWSQEIGGNFVIFPRGLVFFLFGLAQWAYAESFFQYEPAVMEIHGVVSSGRFEHPNGEMYDFHIIKLDVPVSIVADKDNDINGAESGIKEIQIYSSETKIQQAIKSLAGKSVTSKGTIFHEHTAWHRRTLVMDVQEIDESATDQ
jgi:hypothetical protein